MKKLHKILATLLLVGTIVGSAGLFARVYYGHGHRGRHGYGGLFAAHMFSDLVGTAITASQINSLSRTLNKAMDEVIQDIRKDVGENKTEIVVIKARLTAAGIE